MSSVFDNYRDSENDKWYEEENYHKEKCYKEQTHTHEFLGSTKLSEECDERHNHRFVGVTGAVIPRGKSHVHKICIITRPAIPVGNRKHVHLIADMTTFVDGHRHNKKEGILWTFPEVPLLLRGQYLNMLCILILLAK